MSDCKTHTECHQKGTYCTNGGVCEVVTECPVMKDSVTGSCPLDACNAQASCEDSVYCQDQSCYCGEGVCYPKQVGNINVCENGNLRTSLGMPECQ